MRTPLLAFTVAALVGWTTPALAATCTPLACVTMHDTIPNFAGSPTVRSVKAGNWNDPATWDTGHVPTSSDVVAIASAVTISDANAVARTVGISAGGLLRFQPDAITGLTVGTLQVLPQGVLEIGTVAQPVTGHAEIVIANVPLDPVVDPQQFGTGVVVVDGRVTIAGAPVTSYVRLASEPKPGDTTLRLASAVSGWQAGNTLVLPDSKHWAGDASMLNTYTFEGETVTVAGVAADGLSVTLAAAVRFNHPGARDGDDVLEFLPHVGNLSRHVVMRSESPTGTRGHVLITERSDADLRFATLLDLGRTTVSPLDSTTIANGVVTHLGTNQIGRYPLHLHHVYGSAALASGPVFMADGLAVDDSAVTNTHKWAIAIHGSHYGQVTNNVVHNAGGWGIGTEDGSESFNEIAYNFVVKVRGGRVSRGSSEGGSAFWFRGPNNYVHDNVASNAIGQFPEVAIGYDFWFVYLGTICVPNFAGADMTQCTKANGNALPLRQFDRNEAYGSMEIGLSIWWLGANDTILIASAQPSTIHDFRVWNFGRRGYYGYPTNKLTIDGFVARGRKSALANVNEFVMGIYHGDYMTANTTIRRADIQNMRYGIVTPYFVRGTTTIEDSYLRNTVNVMVSTIGVPGGASMSKSLPPKTTILRNVRYAPVSGNVGGVPQVDLRMNYSLYNGAANLIQKDQTFVYWHNGVVGDDFQAFYTQQAEDVIVPQSSGFLIGSPVAGLTNLQNWATYGIAIGGEIATTATVWPGVSGLARKIAPVLPPPQVTGTSAAVSALTFSAFPSLLTVYAGQSLTLGVQATSGTPPAYQWFRSGVAIPGATGAIYATPALTATDAGATYRCTVSNASGTVTTGSLTLAVW